MSITTSVAIATLASMLTLAAPASSTIYYATYTGTLIGYSQDISGVYGPAGTSLYGVPYTATFRMNDALPGAPFVSYSDVQGFHSHLQGGAQNGTTAQAVTGSITVKGVTIAIDASSDNFAYQTHHYYDQSYHYVSSSEGFIDQLVTSFEPFEFLTSADLRTPVDVDVSNLEQATGGFLIYTPNATNAYGRNWVQGSTQVEHLTISAAGAVPEPASWALLVAGFGLVGITSRSKRRQDAR